MTRRKVRRLEKRYRDHPRLVPALAGLGVLFILIVLGFTLRDTNPIINNDTEDAHIVVLYADRETRILPTREKTVGDFLRNAGVTINDGDVVEPDLTAAIEEDDFRVNVYRAAPVLIEDNGTRTLTMSAAQTPRGLAEWAGLTLYSEDEVASSPSKDFLKDGIGSVVRIRRSVPIGLNLYGAGLPTRTLATTVRGLLEEKGVVLAEGDSVQPGLDEPIAGVNHVFVSRSGVTVVVAEEIIPVPEEIIEDKSLSLGTRVIRQHGAPGKKSIAYQVEVINGRERRTPLQEIVLQPPVKQVVARGQAISIPDDHRAIMRAAGIAESDYPYAEYIIDHENKLWCPTRWQGQTHCPAYYEEKFPGAESHRSTGYGLCQSTPANKMASAGDDWRTNPVTQMKWCSNYASRYGGWRGAYEAWSRRAAEGRGWW